MDGPEEFAHCPHMRTEPWYFSTLHQGDQSVMILGTIAYDGTPAFVFSNEKQDSKMFCNVSEEGLLPFAKDIYLDIQLHIRLFFIRTMQQGIRVIKQRLVIFKWWLRVTLDRSPDFNPIENVCGILARSVYHNQGQFTSGQELNLLIGYREAPWLPYSIENNYESRTDKLK